MATLRQKLVLGYLGMLLLSLAALAAVYLSFGALTAALVAAEIVYSGVFLLIMARLVLRPLQDLARSTREIQAGNLNRVVPDSGDDEVSQLARSINAIAATERETRQSERQRLLRTQETARSVIDSLPHAVALVSPEGKLEIVNAGAARFGLQAGHWVNESTLKWLPGLVDQVRATRTRAGGAGSHAEEVLVQVFENGRELFFLPQANPVLLGDGQKELIGITVVLVDVTQARAIDEAKSGLFSAVSHQLKTPLTSIQMSIHLLLEDAVNRLTPRQLELLRAAAEDAERLHREIEELLSAAREKRG